MVSVVGSARTEDGLIENVLVVGQSQSGGSLGGVHWTSEHAVAAGMPDDHLALHKDGDDGTGRNNMLAGAMDDDVAARSADAAGVDVAAAPPCTSCEDDVASAHCPLHLMVPSHQPCACTSHLLPPY